MRSRRAFTLIELIFMVVLMMALLGALFAALYTAKAKALEAARRSACMGNLRNIGLAMFQYAACHNDRFMPLVDAAGNEIPAVDNAGLISALPARSGFVVLLGQGYLTTTKVFICPSSDERLNLDWDYRTDYRKLTPAELAAGFEAANCSYGLDPTKPHWADATCAILADNPPANASAAANGSAANNSPNHRGEGQNVMYNDGHVKWGTTPRPDSGDDPDIYTGGPGYEKSPTDAKIIR